MRKRVIAAALAAMLPIVVNAAPIEGSIPANKTTIVYSFFAANQQSCHAIGKPETSTPIAPQHGHIEFLWRKIVAKNFSSFCDGKLFWSMNVAYTPDPGFTGTDEFKIGMRYPMWEGNDTTTYSDAKFVLHIVSGAKTPHPKSAGHKKHS